MLDWIKNTYSMTRIRIIYILVEMSKILSYPNPWFRRIRKLAMNMSNF